MPTNGWILRLFKFKLEEELSVLFFVCFLEIEIVRFSALCQYCRYSCLRINYILKL